jgi:OOP family OmpA-OmpF porin
MNNFKLKAVTALFTSSVLMGGVAIAQEDEATQPYVTNGKGSVVRVGDRSGPCVKTTSWTEERATKECHPELFPDPVAQTEVTYEAVTLSANALFAFDSAELTSEGMVSLQALGDKIEAKGAQVVDIDIIGHTDSVGPEDYNEQLSLRRATAMKDYLVSEKDVDASIIDVSGQGESAPIADNATPEGRAQNRRVEVNVGVKAPN